MLLNDLKKAALCVAAGFAVTLFGGCDSQKSTGAPAGAGAQRAPQVSVTEIQPTELDMTTTLQGRTAPYLVADVRPQVAGILQKRLFKEGSEVKEGQALYQIDPAVYEAAVASAKAELQRAQAVLYQTRLTANRYAQLVKTNAISKQNNDDAQAAYKQAQAAVAAAQAGLKNAQINLDYTTVRSPITGRIGRSLVTPGALLSAHQTQNMAVVQTLDPIYVDVTQSSKEILSLKKDIAAGKLKTKGGAIPVTLIMEDGSKYPQTGELTLSEVSVDPSTGTITLRAEFPNPDNILLPGMFVRTELPQGTMEKALLVPQRAVMRESNGTPYVYVVDDGKIAIRRLVTHRTQGQDWIVEDGLKPGEKVVIEGLQRIRPGVPVQVVPTMAEQEQAKAAKASKQ
ncbi:efflux RND transporter periplasmic adaptor subunit [uncultured Parasutterella sp.]|jgi:membrane fusion protein (multidrug efflux system)|uniref:efflux RND transporter periplasmic adaptor subunit n=1 Tax=uncultured Parasutterella sp. TaxID=1263098 RepID=UPI0025E904FF|nr:efflux RND transporter periplasmic adaptor subunit [uncultured Parasutterella sp.]